MSCDAIAQKLILLLYGEIEGAERQSVEAHVASCGACRIVLAEERRLHAMLTAGKSIEPRDELLAECRDQLAAELRRSDSRDVPHFAVHSSTTLSSAILSSKWYGWWFRAKPSPAFAAAFLFIGFLSGWAVVGQGLPTDARIPGRPDPADNMTTDLHSMQMEPAGDQVNLTYDTRTRGSMQGRVGDPGIRRLLVDTVRGSANAGMRLDAIDLLEGQVAEADVRRVLMQALRDDRNAGARLKALAALDQGKTTDPEVRAALTNALLRDENLGVRVRAIDALARTGDPELAPLMRRLARDDSEPYIRFRSRAIADEMYAKVSR